MLLLKNFRRIKNVKTAIITGSSRGLGAVIAQTLINKGYNVVVNYKHSKEKAEKLIENISHEKAIAIQADVTERAEVDQMVKVAKEHFGNIDIVINNALVNFKFDPNQQKNFKDLTWEDYQQQLDGTLKAAFNVTQSVIPQFIENRKAELLILEQIYIKIQSSPIMNTRLLKLA